MSPARPRRQRSIALVTTAVVAMVVGVVACGDLLGEDDDGPAPVPPATTCTAPTCIDASASEEPPIVTPPDAACGKPPNDFEGCKCNGLDTKQPCYHGVAVNSPCNEPGSQTCTKANDGETRWTSCVGGSFPEATDQCGNDVDDDCDGRADQTCGACSMGTDLCRPNQDPKAPPFADETCVVKKNDDGTTTDVFSLVKRADVDMTGVYLDGLCLGDALKKPCHSPGQDCKGWYVARFTFNNSDLKPGPHTLDLYKGAATGNPPCVGSPTFICKLTVP